MVIFTPLWETMKKKGFTTYTLRVKYGISGATVQRLKRNMSVSTNTLSDLCDILDCELEDVALYVRDENDKLLRPGAFEQIRALVFSFIRLSPVPFPSRATASQTRDRCGGTSAAPWKCRHRSPHTFPEK